MSSTIDILQTSRTREGFSIRLRKEDRRERFHVLGRNDVIGVAWAIIDTEVDGLLTQDGIETEI